MKSKNYKTRAVIKPNELFACVIQKNNNTQEQHEKQGVQYISTRRMINVISRAQRLQPVQLVLTPGDRYGDPFRSRCVEMNRTGRVVGTETRATTSTRHDVPCPPSWEPAARLSAAPG